MQGKAVMAGLKNLFVSLLTVILFPVAWVKSWRLAKRHTDVSPRGPIKVTVAMVLGVVLLVVGAGATYNFHQGAIDGMYDSLDGRLSSATGNEAWREAVQEGDEEAAARLAGNHALYLQVSAAVSQRDDATALALIMNRDPATLDDSAVNEAATVRAFEIKDDSIASMNQIMTFFVYPGLFGVFYAPLVFAVGGILRAAWVPSDTVGYKPYPHGAAGLFLLLGGFGIPSVLFAAWTLRDLELRSLEGQIAL